MGGTADRARELVGAVDVGTSSVRFYVFTCDSAAVVAYHQIPLNVLFPSHGWVEQDATEVLEKTCECIEQCARKVELKGFSSRQIKAIGVTNQRETLVIWSKETGQPIRTALVWSDNRTIQLVNDIKATLPGGTDSSIRFKTGLHLSPYFTGPKFLWLYRNDDVVRSAVDNGTCLIGTMDSWIVYGLTGEHVTDVSNASRTLFFNICKLKYDHSLLQLFCVPPTILPTVKSSSEIYGKITSGALSGVPISGILGDQQAALVGHLALQPGQCKTTYGTGCFLLCNIGSKPVFSDEGLLTTVAYQLGPDMPARYAFEGAVAVAGAGINWLRDNLRIAKNAAEIELLASQVTESNIDFVPAFSGLYCPYWEPRASGIISGISYSTTNKHLARAALEAVCLHVAEIREIISRSGSFAVDPMYVDGGMCTSDLLMQMQSDIAGMSVVRPKMLEVSALGVAIAAGLAVGVEVFRYDNGSIANISKTLNTSTFKPGSTIEYQMKRQRDWKAALRKCLLDLDMVDIGGVKSKIDVDIARFYPLQIFCLTSLSIYALAEVFN